MNYIQEINCFNEWLTTNPGIKSNEINLWYALMNINNSCGWKPEFAAALSTIIDKTRLSKDSIYRSRNKLVQLGRITVKERPGNQSCIYSIVSLTETQSATQVNGVSLTERQSSTQSATQSATQPATIPKLKETKLKEIGASPEFIKQFERWYQFRKEKKKTLTETTIDSQLKFLCQFPEEERIEIIERSIKNGWVGLFELKDNYQSTTKTSNWKPSEKDSY